MTLTEIELRRYTQSQGYVYLVHAIGTNRYKIGRTVNPVNRLQILKGQSLYPLQIVECFWTPDAATDERELHKECKDIRVDAEWFDFSLDDQNSMMSFLEQIRGSFDFYRPVVTKISETCWNDVTLGQVLNNKNYRNFFELQDLNKFDKTNKSYLWGTGCSLIGLFHKANSLETFVKVYNFAFDILPNTFLCFINSESIKDNSWFMATEGSIEAASLTIFGEGIV